MASGFERVVVWAHRRRAVVFAGACWLLVVASVLVLPALLRDTAA